LQVKYFLGLKLDRTDTAFENLIQIFKHIGESQWREFVMGFTFLVMLLTIKECAKRYKRLRWMRPLGPITVCIISIAAVAIGNLDGKELIKSVSDVPKGALGCIACACLTLLCFTPCNGTVKAAASGSSSLTLMCSQTCGTPYKCGCVVQACPVRLSSAGSR
jgi:Sulfate permease family